MLYQLHLKASHSISKVSCRVLNTLIEQSVTLLHSNDIAINFLACLRGLQPCMGQPRIPKFRCSELHTQNRTFSVSRYSNRTVSYSIRAVFNALPDKKMLQINYKIDTKIYFCAIAMVQGVLFKICYCYFLTSVEAIVHWQ